MRPAEIRRYHNYRYEIYQQVTKKPGGNPGDGRRFRLTVDKIKMGKIMLIALKNPVEISDAPAWFLLLPRGEVQMEDSEPAVMDNQSANMILAEYQKLQRDMVIDYEHQTLSGAKAPAAGWVKGLEWRADGLWVHADWTETAKTHISAKEYRYFSPVFLLRKNDRRITKLYNIGLTNQPRMKNIRAIINKQEIQTGGEMIEEIKQKLNTDDAGVLPALQSLISAKHELETLKKDKIFPVACSEVLDALGLKADAGKSEAVATVHALKQKPDLIAEVTALKSRLAERDKNDLVNGAMQQGKITAAQKEWAEAYALKDPEGFRIFVAKAPAVVPMGETKPAPDGKTPADDTQLEVNKQLGISAETFEKFGPKQADKGGK